MLLTALLIAGAAAPPAVAAPALVVRNVNVVPMDRERVLRSRDVTVRDGVITAIGGSAPRDPGTVVIDGRGRYLVPGLADMHVHSTTSRDMTLFLAKGVTTVLNMGGARTDFVGQAVPKINRGERPGPHIYLALRVDGTPQYGQLVVSNADQARATVTLAKTNGYDFIKVYNNLAPATFAAFIEEGRRQGLPVVGHGLTQVGLRHQLEGGQLMVAHLEEYFYTYFFEPEADVGMRAPKSGQIADAVGATKRAGAFVTADLATFAAMSAQWGRPEIVRQYLAESATRYLAPDDRIAWRHAGYIRRTGSLVERHRFLKRFAKALADGGVPLLVGTDTPTMPGLVPGFSVVSSLRALEDAGLTRFEALSAATRSPGMMIARAKPAERCFGVIAVGCRADFLLTASNPLHDLETLREPLGVHAGKSWYTAAALAKSLDDLEREYRAVAQ